MMKGKTIVLAVVMLLTACVLAAMELRPGSPILNDMFAGFAGDKTAFKRSMEAIEKLLAENPNDAEAMVWHGAGTLFQSRLDGETDGQKRIASFQQGTAEMDRAVSLAPDNIAVRIPRGGVLRMLTPGMPNFPILATLIENARKDYQFAFDRRQEELVRLSTHQLGELLQGLGDLNSRQGKTADAEKYYGMILTKLKGTPYAERATEWMKTRQPLPPEQTACIGCHTATK
jgi:tetratricopeptide (TPR) repeat protein